MTGERMPAFFISHGGGPWPAMHAEYGNLYEGLRTALEAIPRQLGGRRPRAVLVVSAHWEAPEFTIQAHERPPILYDYSGFPPHTYALRYDAPGAPEVAAQAQELLRQAGIRSGMDTQRGYDHGSFVPMMLIYPQADVPVLQLSLRRGLDPAEHLKAGRAISVLRDRDVLIIGSGSSYHNMELRGATAAAPSRAFDSWLQHSLTEAAPGERWRRLVDWARAPGAQICHPRAEHLLPLMLTVGAAGNDAGVRNFSSGGGAGGPTVSNFRFG